MLSIVMLPNSNDVRWLLSGVGGIGNATISVTCSPAPPPIPTGFSPTSGWATGETTVTLSGSGFDGATGVTFGGVSADFTVNSDSSITATAPAHTAGAVAVAVTRPDGTWLFPDGFTYQAQPTVTLSSSDANPTFGTSVTFTATLTNAATPTGSVELFDGDTSLGSAPLSGSAAALSISTLGAGSHTITAVYSGDTNNAPATSAPLTQTVRALSSVVIRQEADGTDAVFGFSSSTSGLNLSVPTSGGLGQSAAIALPAGSYVVTADDMAGAGFILTALVCSDTDSSANLASRTANIVLDAGEALVCTFTSVNAREHTTKLIEGFLTTRADLILANQPDLGRRIGRINGAVSSGGNPVPALMGYLPGIVEGNPLSVSTSLAAIDSLAGNQQPGPFDIWFEGTFALFDAHGPNGNFNTASLGADYLVNPDLLIGGFVQLDHLSQSSTLNASTISGTGWLAGPYATARLSENLYLDILAAAGTSSNKVSPYGTFEDGFDATRYLLNASLQGQWQWDSWTFSPRARASYFEETSKAYTDSLGVDIPSITAGLGQIAVGPAISYRYTTEGNVVIDTGLRFEGVADILNTSAVSGFDNLHGRIEGTIDLSLPGGARIGLSAAYDGIGSAVREAASAKATVSLPFN